MLRPALTALSAALLAMAATHAAVAAPPSDAAAAASAALAEEAAEKSIFAESRQPLAEVVSRAFERSAQQGTLSARREDAAARQQHAKSLISGNPSLFGDYYSDRFDRDIGRREWEIGVSVPVWRPGERSAARAWADANSEAVQAGTGALHLLVAGDVREVLWEAALLRNAALLAKNEWDTAQALQADVAKRVRYGEAANTDLLLAREETLRRQGVYVQAETDYVHALKRYQILTGLLNLPKRRREPMSTQTTVPEDHPLLVQLRRELARARQGLTLARESKAESPTLGLSTRSERDSSGLESVGSVGLSFTLPLGTAAHSRPKVTAAGVGLAEVESRLIALRRELEVALHDAEQQVEATTAQLALAEEQNRLATENLRLAKVAFSAGETDLVHLLRVQNIAFAAERNVQQLRITHQRAVARYNQAVGVIP